MTVASRGGFLLLVVITELLVSGCSETIGRGVLGRPVFDPGTWTIVLVQQPGGATWCGHDGGRLIEKVHEQNLSFRIEREAPCIEFEAARLHDVPRGGTVRLEVNGSITKLSVGANGVHAPRSELASFPASAEFAISSGPNPLYLRGRVGEGQVPFHLSLNWTLPS